MPPHTGLRTCVSVLLHAPVAWALSYVSTTNRHSSAGATVARSTAASPCCAIAGWPPATGRAAGAEAGEDAAVTAPRQPGWRLRLDPVVWVWPQALLLLLLILPPPLMALLPELLLLLGVIRCPALGSTTGGCWKGTSNNEDTAHSGGVVGGGATGQGGQGNTRHACHSAGDGCTDEEREAGPAELLGCQV